MVYALRQLYVLAIAWLKSREAYLFLYMNNSRTRILRALLYRTARLFPDRLYLKMLFPLRTGYSLNLDCPQTFNEKLQWLKLYDRRPEYTKMVDKVEAKKYVTDVIGEVYIIPTLAVYNRAEDIHFDALPNQFVLKCTHDSGSIIICNDKTKLNRHSIIKKLKKDLQKNYYYQKREWPYKNVKPQIIAEKYIHDDTEHEGLTDYKFFCFNGYVDCVMICVDRQIGDPKFYFFDQNWNLLPLNVRGKNMDPSFKLPKPVCIQEMFEIAGRLSEGIPFVRVDLYCSDGRPKFGEMTFFPTSGFDKNLLYEAEQRFGDLIDLSIVSKKE